MKTKIKRYCLKQDNYIWESETFSSKQDAIKYYVEKYSFQYEKLRTSLDKSGMKINENFKKLLIKAAWEYSRTHSKITIVQVEIKEL